MGNEESDINNDLARLVRLLWTAFPKHWENHLRNFFRGSVPAELPPAELDRLTKHVFWLVKQTGIRDPAAWLASDRAQQEAAIVSAPAEPEAAIEIGGDQRGPVDPAPVKRGDEPVQSSAEPPPAPVAATVANKTTKAELPPPAKAAMSETEGPKTETTALGAMGRKQGRGGGRKKQKLPAETSKARQKRHERMRVVLDSLRECPALSDAAKKAGIHRKTPENWIKRSEAGNAGYDIEWQGWMLRFHEHCEGAKEEAFENRVAAAWEIAKGVVYKYDEALLSLGFEGPDAYARDQNGNPIPEVIFKPRARRKMFRFLLEWRDKYGNHPKIDSPQQGGIVFVDVPFGPRPSGPDAPPSAPPARESRPKKIENSSAASVKVRKWKSLSRMIRKAKV